MKLREKILLLSGIALTSCAYLLYIASSRVFLGNFQRLEEQQADHSARQALQALEERIDALHTVNADWARWDEACAFVSDTNSAFRASNLNAETLGALRLNLLAIVRTDGAAAFAAGFDYIARRFRPVPADAETQVVASPQLLARCLGGEAVRGLIITAEGPMMVAAHPILRSTGEGPPRGMLAMGRFLEIREMTDLRRVSRQTMNLHALDDPIVSAEMSAARAIDLADPPVKVGTPGDNVIAGYGTLTDIAGKPILVLRTVLPRNIVAEGRRDVNIFLLVLIVAGLAATVIVAALFERLVLSPLARLRSDVAWTAARGSLSARLPVSGDDEIAATAREINRLLDTAEHIHQRARAPAGRQSKDTEPELIE